MAGVRQVVARRQQERGRRGDRRSRRPLLVLDLPSFGPPLVGAVVIAGVLVDVGHDIEVLNDEGRCFGSTIGRMVTGRMATG